jgi:hypothetical protein
MKMNGLPRGLRFMREGSAFFLATTAASLLFACAPPPEPKQRRAASAVRLTGKVLEQMDSPPYTFLRLGTASGEAWAAVPIGAVAKDRVVSVVNAVPLRDFEIGPAGRRVTVLYLGEMER